MKFPYPFFAQWLNLVLEIAKIIEPDFHVEIPEKRLDWFSSPDQEVFDIASGSSYVLRTSSVLLQNGDCSIQVLAQYGYNPIPDNLL